jgi:hypothetical protein
VYFYEDDILPFCLKYLRGTVSRVLIKLLVVWIVPDRRSRDLEVVVVGRIINLGTGNLEWGGNGKGLRKGRTVYETKVDEILSQQGGFPSK